MTIVDNCTKKIKRWPALIKELSPANSIYRRNVTPTSFPVLGEFKKNPDSFGVLNLIVVDASAESRIPELPSWTGGERSNFMLVILNDDKVRDKRDIEISDITRAIGGMLDHDVPYFTRTGNTGKVFCLDQASKKVRLKRALAENAPAAVDRKVPEPSSAASASAGGYSAGSPIDASGVFCPGQNRASSVIRPFSKASVRLLSEYKTSLMTYLDAQTKRMPSGDAKRRALEEAKARVRDSQTVNGVQAIVGEIRSIVSQHRNSVYRFFASIVSHPRSRRELDEVFNAENELIRPASQPQPLRQTFNF